MNTGFNLNQRKVLITGATGFIGGHVARRLVAEGAQIRVLARNPAKALPLADLGAEVVKGDMLDADTLRQAVKGCQAVFHFAGVLGDEFKPLDYFRQVNVEGTRILAEAALDVGVERFIHASTIWAYGLEAGKNIDENTPRQYSRAPYCDTKLDAEKTVFELHHTRKLPVVVVQPSVVYGPEDEAWTLGPLRLMQAKRMIIPGHGRGLVTPIFIDDLVDGILIAAQKGATGEAYILSGDEVVTFKAFFHHLAGLLGRSKLPSVPGWLALLLARLSETWARLTRTQPMFTVEAVRGTLMIATYKNEKAKALGFQARHTLSTGMQVIREWLDEKGRAYLYPGK